MTAQKSKYDPINKYKYVGDVNNIVCRSSWERGVCKWLDLNDDVTAWTSETVVVPYMYDGDNQIHRYFVDFCIRYKSGSVVLVEVKPHSQTLKPKATKNKRQDVLLEEIATYTKNVNKWEAAIAFCKNNKMEFQIWSEDVLQSIGIPIGGR